MLSIILILLILVLILVGVSLWYNHLNTAFIYQVLVKNRKLDSERHDRVDRIIQQIITSQNSLDEKIDDVSGMASVHDMAVTSQLQKIQALVNSDMMAARRDELIRTKELKIALERIVTLTTLSRQQPDVRYITAIESATSRIEQLETILGIRTYP